MKRLLYSKEAIIMPPVFCITIAYCRYVGVDDNFVPSILSMHNRFFVVIMTRILIKHLNEYYPQLVNRFGGRTRLTNSMTELTKKAKGLNMKVTTISTWKVVL